MKFRAIAHDTPEYVDAYRSDAIMATDAAINLACLLAAFHRACGLAPDHGRVVQERRWRGSPLPAAWARRRAAAGHLLPTHTSLVCVWLRARCVQLLRRAVLLPRRDSAPAGRRLCGCAQVGVCTWFFRRGLHGIPACPALCSAAGGVVGGAGLYLFPVSSGRYVS